MSKHLGFHVPVGRVFTTDGVQLRFVVPGVREEDIRLWVEADRLVVSGKRIPPAGAGRLSDLALHYGQFIQEERLPVAVDSTAMRVDIHHGLVDVFLPFVHRPALASVPQKPAMLARAMRRLPPPSALTRLAAAS
ncbi:MAG: Hsp20/alpha crystallin family protein [Acidobacteriota bacterium]|nr:Hsp20/alpha crystallin family protein [Acidobacteriota bacterium]